MGASRRPDDLAVIDVDDPLHPEVTFSDIEHRCNALARGLIDRGITEQSVLGLLARNSRAYVEVMVAVSRIGADLIYFDTNTPTASVGGAVTEYGVSMMVRNSAFASRCPSQLPWLGTDDPAGVSLLDALPIRGKMSPPDTASRHLLAVPGGGHGEVSDLGLKFEAFAGLLDVLPLRLAETHLIAAPISAPWGWLHHRLAATLGATEVLVRQSEPERLLALVQAHDVSVLAITATALAQILDLPPQVRQRYDVSTLTCVAVDSPLPPSLSEAALGFFGDSVYVGFGTGTTAVVSIAGPDDLRLSPATAGKPLPGTRVSVVDETGRSVPTGQPGWLHVEVRGAAVADPRPQWARLDEHGRLTVLPNP